MDSTSVHQTVVSWLMQLIKDVPNVESNSHPGCNITNEVTVHHLALPHQMINPVILQHKNVWKLPILIKSVRKHPLFRSQVRITPS